MPSGVSAIREIDVVTQIRPSSNSRRTISARGSSGVSPAPFSSGTQPSQASSTLAPGLGWGSGIGASRGWYQPMRSISGSPARPLLTTRCRPGGRSRRRKFSPSHSCSSTRPGSATSRRNGSKLARLVGGLGVAGALGVAGRAGAGVGDGLSGGGQERELAAGTAGSGRGGLAAAVEDAGHAGRGGRQGQPGAAGLLVAAADQAGLIRPVVPGGLPGALGEFKR